MAKLKQIQIRFAPVEDRLLLRVNSTDNQEFRFWLTRRYVKLLLPVVYKLLALDDRVQQQSENQARQTVMEFQHDSAVSNTDFVTEYDESPNSMPLGASPVLLAKLQVRTGDKEHVLSMQPERGQGVELSFNPQLLHGFLKLIMDALAQTEWNIDENKAAVIEPDQTTSATIN